MTLLPPNATPLERAVEQTTARLSDVPVPIALIADPDRCPVALLPYLAWALSIDTWSADWPEAVKRARVRSAIAIQRRKGTAASVRDVVASFGGGVALREWWQTEPRGRPHTFDLVVSLDGVVRPEATAAYADAVIGEVARTKPVRSAFTFSQALTAEGAMGAIAAARPAIFARLNFVA
jgi:phage tail P2-like protein